MSWRLVARQGVRESWRNWELPGTIIAFALIFGLIGYWTGPAALGSGNDGSALFGLLAGTMLVLVPATAVTIAHDDVAGRREDGRLRLLLGQPISRRSIVLGQYLATVVTIVSAVLVAVSTGLFIASVRAGELAPPEMAATLVGAGVLMGLSYLGIGIAISTALKTTNFSGTLAFAAFLGFTFVWQVLPRSLLWVVDRFVDVPSNPWWLVYVDTMSPVLATGRLIAPGTSYEALAGTDDVTVTAFAGVVLCWWIVVLPMLALMRFERTDL